MQIGKYYNHDPKHYTFVRSTEQNPIIESHTVSHFGDRLVFVCCLIGLAVMLIL